MSETSYTQAAADMLARWGASGQMNPMEAAMWRGEVEPRLRSTVMSLEILDTTPDWDRLMAATRWGVATIPRARQRVVAPPLGISTPLWVEDEEFDLDYHVRPTAAPGDGSLRDLLDVARTIGMSPFERSRPPWEVHLVEGLADGKAAMVTKLHHSLTDGLGGVQLAALARSRTREHTPDKPIGRGRPAAADPPSLLEQGLSLGRTALKAPLALTSRAAKAAGYGLKALRDPGTEAAEALRYADSFRRIVGEGAAPGSPLLAQRSASWHLDAHDVPLAAMKAASKAVDASINDLYIAALMGAFGRYHDRFDSPVDVMPVAFPISIRKPGDEAGGNRFAGARIAGPVGVRDPVERVRAIREAVRTVRSEPAVAALAQLAGAMVHLPTAVLTKVMLALGEDNDLQASNVPGVPHETFLAGAKVETVYPFGPLPGCAAMITMLSQAGTCGIGINVDPAAVTDPAAFKECLVEGFEEILALGA